MPVLRIICRPTFCKNIQLMNPGHELYNNWHINFFTNSAKSVDKAVTVLLNLHASKQKEKPDIVDVPKKIDLQFNFKKVPLAKNKRLKINLPHSIHYDTKEVCLFVKDLDEKSREYEVTTRHFKELLDSKGINTISKIVPVKALRTDYSPFDAKKSLANAYDLFLADERIMGLLPGTLGKAFFSKKCKRPVQVNMKAKDLKMELEKAISNTHCILAGRGSSSMVTVAHTDITQEQIVENVIAAASQVSQSIQGGPRNIKNFYIKSTDTSAIPLYVSLDSGEGVELPSFQRSHGTEYIDDITTVLDGKVKVRADGAIQIVDDSGKPLRKFKRSHEDDEESQSAKRRRKKTKRKSRSAKSSALSKNESKPDYADSGDKSAKVSVKAGEMEAKKSLQKLTTDGKAAVFPKKRLHDENILIKRQKTKLEKKGRRLKTKKPKVLIKDKSC